MTGTWFLAYVQQVLSPTLRRGDVVILDDLPAHKITSVREAVEATGAKLLVLPPYSPDFNPIENAFSKLKALLRKAAARTVDELWAAVASAIDTFTPAESTNYFAAAGYDAWRSDSALVTSPLGRRHGQPRLLGRGSCDLIRCHSASQTSLWVARRGNL